MPATEISLVKLIIQVTKDPLYVFFTYNLIFIYCQNWCLQFCQTEMLQYSIALKQWPMDKLRIEMGS